MNFAFSGFFHTPHPPTAATAVKQKQHTREPTGNVADLTLHNPSGVDRDRQRDSEDEKQSVRRLTALFVFFNNTHTLL